MPNVNLNGHVSVGSIPSTGTNDYNQLANKPKINSVTLQGNKTLDDLNIQEKGDYLTEGEELTNLEVLSIINSVFD